MHNIAFPPSRQHAQKSKLHSPLGFFTNTARKYLLPFAAINGQFFRDDDSKLFLADALLLQKAQQDGKTVKTEDIHAILDNAAK